MMVNFRNTDWETIAGLPHDMLPQWGSMRLQHMIEHLADVFGVCNGTMQVAVYTPADKVEKVKRIALMSDRDLQQNFKSPILPGTPIPYRTANMQEAIKHLEKEILKFEQHFDGKNGHTENHPVFGPLNYDEWVHFHNKHFTHHFKQFNLL